MLLTGYDLRGIFKKEFTFDIIYKATAEFFKKLNLKKALLGVDCNKNNFLIKDFLEKNFNFKFLGVLPTPIFYYQVIKRKTPGIMITASHLPKRYSGLKFILKNGEPWKPSIRLASRLVRCASPAFAYASARTFAHGLPESHSPNSLAIKIRHGARITNKKISSEIYKDYFTKLYSLIQPKKKIFVNFDKKNFFLDTSLPYFAKLKIYQQKNSPIKIKSDLDNDRIFVYIKNKKIHNDLIFYHLALLPRYQKLGVPIFFSHKLRHELIKKGKKIYFIQTGHYYFKKAFKKYNLDLAFEPSGHFYMFKDLKTEAPYLALGLFLHSLEDLDEILKFNNSLGLYRFDVKIHEAMRTKNELRRKTLTTYISFLKKKYKLKLRKFDGYLLFNEMFFLHLRQSQTENKIRASFEGDKKILKDIKKWLMKI